MSEEQKFKVTEYISQEKELTKDQYIAHLRRKLEYAFDKTMDTCYKKIKLEDQLDKEKDDMAKVLAEIIKINGKELADKDVDYATWRYKELNPKKAKVLYSKRESKIPRESK